mmetsp:Transcript_96703/g.177122  ORF Transcript_96703/g.177122 Transcript_96703/m.177122 type:complete len:366 (+) Transcript_96703:76-1173(+)
MKSGMSLTICRTDGHPEVFMRIPESGEEHSIPAGQIVAFLEMVGSDDCLVAWGDRCGIVEKRHVNPVVPAEVITKNPDKNADEVFLWKGETRTGVPNGTVLSVTAVDINNNGFFYTVLHDGNEYTVKQDNVKVPPQTPASALASEAPAAALGPAQQAAVVQQFEGHPDVVLRSSAPDGRPITRIPNGTTARILSSSAGGYVKIEVDQHDHTLRGWVKQQNLQGHSEQDLPLVTEARYPSAKALQCDGHPHVILRSAAPEGHPIAQIPNGTTVSILGCSVGDYLEIMVQQNQQTLTGWVKRHNLQMQMQIEEGRCPSVKSRSEKMQDVDYMKDDNSAMMVEKGRRSKPQEKDYLKKAYTAMSFLVP